MIRDLRGFLAGVALSAPFVANPLPSNSWALVIVVPLALHVLRHGVRLFDLRPDPMILAIFVVAALHAVFLLTGPTPYYFSVARDIVMALSACAIVLVVKPSERGAIVDGFFSAAMVVAFAAASVGLVKFILMANGILIPAFIFACGVDYPQGSALCGDYNLFGLLLLIGGIGFIRSITLDALPQGLKVSCLALVVFAMMLSGSRRAIFLCPLLLVYWVALSAKLHISIRRIAAPAALIIVAAIAGATTPGFNIHATVAAKLQAAGLARPPGDQHEAAPLGNIAVSPGNIAVSPGKPSEDRSEAEKLRAQGDFVVRDTSIAALATTFSAEEGYGVGSRFNRWRLAWDMIKERPFSGHGFAYHQRFSCHFIKCEHIDYPHAPILSGWIAGGPVGLVAVIAFYGLALSSMLLFRGTGWVDGSLPALLATLPFSLISGDTVFSIPQFAVVALLAWRLWQRAVIQAVRSDS